MLRLELGPDGVWFVRTASYEAEEAADRVLTRDTFGTPSRVSLCFRQPAFATVEEPPAHTHVVRRGRTAETLLAFSDVGLPRRLDPRTRSPRWA